jgi:hypothetical protein
MTWMRSWSNCRELYSSDPRILAKAKSMYGPVTDANGNLQRRFDWGLFKKEPRPVPTDGTFHPAVPGSYDPVLGGTMVYWLPPGGDPNQDMKPMVVDENGNLYDYISADGNNNVDDDPNPDIACSTMVTNALLATCYEKPGWWGAVFLPEPIGVWTGHDDPNYQRVDLGPNGIDLSDVGPGDVVWLLPQNDPTESWNQHTQIVETKPVNAGNGWWSFKVFHSLEDGYGPDTVEVRVFDTGGHVTVIGRSGNRSYYLGGIYRPREFCPCPSVYEPLPPLIEEILNLGSRDPLILDLDGQGIQTFGLNAGIHFDYDGNGFQELTGWVAPGNGMLVFDINGNDSLDGGAELFGDFTPLANGMLAANGFEALAQYDANNDGKIDSSDPIWSQLSVYENYYYVAAHSPEAHLSWRMTSVEELGLNEIWLASEITNTTDAQGNTEVRTGHFQWEDGSSGTIAEYRLTRDRSDTIASEVLDVPPELGELPGLHGYGNVYDLHQAIMRDSSNELRALVEEFTSETNPTNRASILDEIIFKWTGVDSVTPAERGQFMDGRKVAVLEKIYGRPLRNPNRPLATVWQNIYRDLFEFFYADLMAQTHLKDLYATLTYEWNEEKQEYEIDTSGLIAALDQAIADDPAKGKELLSEFARTRRGMGFFDENCFLSVREHFIEQDPSLGWYFDKGALPVYDKPGMGDGYYKHITGTDNADAVMGRADEGDGWISGLNGNDVIYGSSRSEHIYQETGDAIIVGGGGNDRIYAGADDDILDGGTGNDTLYGERGNDTYIFRRGSGQDTIIDPDPTEGNIDTIWLGSNLTPDEITLVRSGNHLVLKINDTSDKLTVRDMFRNNSPLNRIEQIQFMDGTVWTYDDILVEASHTTEGDDIIYGDEQDNVLSGAGGNDQIYGLEGADTLNGDLGNDLLYGADGEDALNGGDGNDTLYGGQGDDVLSGGAGSDKLYGQAGDDTLQGGLGNDLLNGSTGNDIYLFNLGDGQDTIYDTDSTPGNYDTIELGEGILPTDVKPERIGNDLKLTIEGTTDSITVKNWIRDNTPGIGVGSITFADGTIWDTSYIADVLVKGTDTHTAPRRCEPWQTKGRWSGMGQGSVGRIPGGLGEQYGKPHPGLVTDIEFMIRVVQGITSPLSRRGPF